MVAMMERTRAVLEVTRLGVMVPLARMEKTVKMAMMTKRAVLLASLENSVLCWLDL